MATFPDNLACPLDSTALVLHERQLICASGHHFDVARQGYVNLLSVQHKKSKSPGDNKAMVAARTAFLNTQQYRPIAITLANVLDQALGSQPNLCVVDAGCGEGYYVDVLARTVQANILNWVGVDISKIAIQAATKRVVNAAWLVASNKQLPVLPKSVDAIVSVFGFPHAEGFAHALKPEGCVIVVEPAAKHLVEMREILYEELRQPVSSSAPWHKDIFIQTHQQCLTYKTKPMDANTRMSLLQMTPHFYRAPKTALENVYKMMHLSVTVDVVVRVYRLGN